MKFRPGDMVIKTSGGNKMKIVEYTPNGVQCVWVSEKYQEGIFNESDLIHISEYTSVLITHERDDKIQQILNK
jgi:uncharacterized protein YodC (DUF2158 family)